MSTTGPRPPDEAGPDPHAGVGFLSEARRRGVVRVATSYAVIAWLLIQIASTTFGPLGVPAWILTTLIVVAFVGFPIACVLAWFFELTPQGIARDTAPAQAARPTTTGVRRYADVAIISVLVAVVAMMLVRQRELEHSLGLTNPALAVMPFVNMSGDPAQEFFSDGIAEELIGKLGSVPGLKVTGRSSSFALKGSNLDAPSIAAKLGVNAILEGSVRRSGELLRLSASLVDARTGFQLWSASYERKPTEIFDIQDEITRAVAAAVIPDFKQQTGSQQRTPTSDLTAHDYYLLGIANRWKRDQKGVDSAIGFFEKAIERDPDYARAHAALGRMITLRDFTSYTVSPDNPAAVRAEKEVYRALALDPSLAETQGALGTLLWRTGRPGSAEAYERALRINPNDAVVLHDYAVSLGETDLVKSEQLNRRTLEVDPLAVVTRANYLEELLCSGRRDAFERESRRALSLHHDDAEALQIFAFSASGLGLVGQVYRIGKMELVLDERALGNLLIAGSRLYIDPAAALEGLEAARRQGEEVIPAPLMDVVESGERMQMGDLRGRVEVIRRYQAQNPDDSDMQDALAFTLVLQERYAEAAAQMTTPLTLHDSNSDFGVTWRQGVPARLLAFRKTGRGKDAQRVLDFYKGEMLPFGKARPGCHFVWTTIAAVESLEGHQDAAVDALRTAFKVTDYPSEFQPLFPWFKSLEKHPGYAEVLAERTARIAQLKQELARIDAEFAQPAPAGTPGN